MQTTLASLDNKSQGKRAQMRCDMAEISRMAQMNVAFFGRLWYNTGSVRDRRRTIVVRLDFGSGE